MDLVGACGDGDYDLVQTLLNDDEWADELGPPDLGPALVQASSADHVEIVELLLAYHPKVNYHNDNGETALINSSYAGYVAVVKLLLKSGAKINDTDDNGATALMAACDQGQTTAAKVLLDAGAAVNQVDYDGDTALSYACLEGHLSAAKLLLEHGADPDIVNRDGKTAIDQTDSHNNEIVSLFRTRRRFKLWRTATRTWCIANFWWKVAGEGQHAPGERGHKRACTEFARDALYSCASHASSTHLQ